MLSPKFPDNELERQSAVNSYDILDTIPEKDYDDLTTLIATICDIPIALIAVLDNERNFFKSHFGIPFNESPRNISFCGHTILENDILIVNDARADERFVDNPLVTEHKAIFYAGVPLVNPEGFPLGTMCVFDHKPRILNETQIEALKTLGRQVVNLLELRRYNFKLKKIKMELEERNDRLKIFASHVSHDLKSPLSVIASLTKLLKEENATILSAESKEYLNYIDESTGILKDYIDGILTHYKSDELLKSKKENVNLKEISDDIKHILMTKKDQLIYNDVLINNINKSALSQILINLVDNGLKYNKQAIRIVKIEYESLPNHHKFSVTDNGMGIPKDKQDEIFTIFSTVRNDYGKTSTGIGLSTVKNLVEKLGGEITVHSELGKGSTFSFTIAI